MERELAQLRRAYKTDYARSIRPDIDPARLAVKKIGSDTVQGYVTVWGTPEQTDLEREYFTPQTDFWDGVLSKAVRPLTWDHALDGRMKANPIVGTINEIGDDELGRWYTATLDRAHAYRRMIDRLIEAGAIGTSSDSAPQYVVRTPVKGATWLSQWPLFAAALTPTPCEPRLAGSVEIIKSLGVELPTFPEALQDAERDNGIDNKRRLLNLYDLLT